LFPLLLLVWRRVGMGAAVLAAMILGYLPHKLSHGGLDFAKFHYIGLFAVGMAACWIATSKERRAEQLRSLPWGAMTALSTVGSFFTVPRNFGSVSNFGLPDYVPALASDSLLVYCTLCAARHGAKRTHLVRMLETPWLAGAGRFSYSLYLIHYPLLALAYAGLSRLDCSAESRLILLGCVCCPLIVALAFLFFRLFEKPFVERKSQN
jgi:peptidoglycan/LPS O-acetylase OafA/YrhL